MPRGRSEGQSRTSSTCMTMISDSQRKTVNLILQNFIFLFHMMLCSTKRDVAAPLMRYVSSAFYIQTTSAKNPVDVPNGCQFSQVP